MDTTLGATSGTPAQESSFVYMAVTGAGRRKFGVRSAAGADGLVASLEQEGLLPLRSWRVPGLAGRRKPLALRDQAQLHTQLARLVSRGAPLTEALEVAEDVVSRGTKQRVRSIRERVAAGESFSHACAGDVDPAAAAVYRAAEKTGDIGGAAERLAAAAKRRIMIAGKTITMLVYPAVVCVVGVGVMAFMLTFLMPRIGKMLEDANASMPAATRLLVSLGRWLQTGWPTVVVGLALAGVLAVLFRAALLAAVTAIARRVPAVASLWAAADAARFFTVAAAMARSGVPLAEALGVGAQVVTLPKLRQQIEGLKTGLIEGASLGGLVEGVTELPSASRRLLVAADRAGAMDEGLQSLADDAVETLDTSAQRAMAMLESGIILGLFLLIGPMILAVVWPMLNMTQNI